MRPGSLGRNCGATPSRNSRPGRSSSWRFPTTSTTTSILEALRHGQHVCAVKPMVHSYRQAVEIREEARRRNLLVAVEYHKRFDDRNLIARRAYREGRFGEFRLGAACLFEKWYYRESNFQNWMTADRSDAFSYVGCHYVDLVAFITGLTPVSVSVYGILDRFPNGAEGYLWSDARVVWSNGACLNVQNGLGVPAAAPGSNAQGLTMYFTAGRRRRAAVAWRPVPRRRILLRRAGRLCRAQPRLLSICRPGRPGPHARGLWLSVDRGDCGGGNRGGTRRADVGGNRRGGDSRHTGQ